MARVASLSGPRQGPSRSLLEPIRHPLDPPHPSRRPGGLTVGGPGRRRRPVGVLRHRPGPVQCQGPARRPRPEGDGGEGGRHEPLRARLEVGGQAAGAPSTGIRRTASSAPWPRAGSGRPRSSGGRPRWVAKQPRSRPARHAPPTGTRWANFLKAAVARYGPGGAYWGNRYHRPIRSERHPAAHPLLAGVERAQPEEVLQSRQGSDSQAVKTVRASCCGSRTTRSGAGIATAQIVLAGNPGYPPDGGPQGLGIPRPPLPRPRGQERLRRRRPAPLRVRPPATSD